MEWNAYKQSIKRALDLFKFDQEIVDVLKGTVGKKQHIFVAGNGGSAAIALHYVCDFSKGANQNWSENFNRFRTTCLSSNLGYLTAIANDAHYNEVFKQQLINLASPGDILVLISSSGNSPNIVEAAKYAKELGMSVIGITGFSGGKLKEIADYSAHIECPSYEVVEDIHSVFGHYLASYMREP